MGEERTWSGEADDREHPPAASFTAIGDITEDERVDDGLHKYQEGLDRIVAERMADLAAANTRLEAANRELQGFTYSVSHDLRAPLRAIDGFSRALLEDYADKLDSGGRRLLYLVRNNTVKLSNLIDDISAFSRIGCAEMQPAPLDMEALVRDILDVPLAPAIAGRALTIDIGPLPPARGDPAMLGRVWTNLLDNAVKFTAPKPDPRIEVGAAIGDGETVYWVRDNGVGFDMQRAGKLFGLFQRLHGSEFAGTGVGLAIVKGLVARHGGRVWAEGKLSEGAVMYFTLPTEKKTLMPSQSAELEMALGGAASAPR